MLVGLTSPALGQTSSACQVTPLAVTLGTFVPNGQPGLTFAGESLIGVLTVAPCPEGGQVSVSTNPQVITHSGPCGSIAAETNIIVFSGQSLVTFTLPLSVNAVPNRQVVATFSGNGQQALGQFFLSPGRISLTALNPIGIGGGEGLDPSLTLFTPSAGAAQVVSQNPAVVSFAGSPQSNFQVPFNPAFLVQEAFPGPLQVNSVASLTTVTLNAIFRPCTTDFNDPKAPTLTDSLQLTIQPEPILHKMTLKITNLDGSLLKTIGLRLVERFDGATFFELDQGSYVGAAVGGGGGGGGGTQHIDDLTLSPQTYKLGQGWGVQIVPVQDDGTEGKPITQTETLSGSDDQSDQSPDNSAIFDSFTELFEGQVLVHFPLKNTATRHRFFPVHSGSSNLTLKFSNLRDLTLNIPIFITNCTTGDCAPQLGSAHPEFDTLLMRVADRNGIPPQLLKAQIQQESAFKPNAYRYESLSFDFSQIIAPLRAGSHPFDLLRQKAFASWALAESTDCTPAGIFIPQGAKLDLSTQDASRREIYKLALFLGEPECRVFFPDRTRPTRNIQSTDALPSWDNVFFTNDGVLVDWSHQAAQNRARTDLRFYEYQIDHPQMFTAETVIAASYGLHQLMYPTAVGMGYIDEQGIGLPPGQLLVPQISLDLGTEYLAGKFGVKGQGVQHTDYTDQNDFLFQFAPALRRFNAGNPRQVFSVSAAKTVCLNGPITSEFAYACRILKNTKHFIPVPVIGGTGQ